MVNKQKIPNFKSIREEAKFWDTHDLTDFEDQLEEVTETVFERETETVMQIHLQPKEFHVVEQLAKSKGIRVDDLIREWVLEKIHLKPGEAANGR